MYKLLLSLFSFTLFSINLCAQVYPLEGSKLNYRLIGVSFPPVPQTNNYTIQIANGHYTSIDSFSRNIIVTQSANTDRLIVEVPSFGQQYTWRVISGAVQQNKVSDLHHFSTGMVPAVDTNLNRLRIVVPAKKYKDATVFIDAVGVLYDMTGKPIWYLPYHEENMPGDMRDLKLSPSGSITFLLDSKAYEVNYNGNILWSEQGKMNQYNDLASNVPVCHHELTRLDNGHYMTMGSEDIVCKLPTLKDSTFLVIPPGKNNTDTGKAYKKMAFGTLIEFDENGNVVWKWESLKYIIASDLKYVGLYSNWIDLHDNAFFFDEKNSSIYISFRDINRVIKIKYPEGNVLNVYGDTYKYGIVENEHTLFHAQHACRLSAKGYLYLFDNETSDAVSSKIIMMQEPLKGNGRLEKKWEYTCNIDDKDGYTLKGQNAGGNVIELPGQSIFAAMGKQFSKVFIVSMNKEILWSAISEKWSLNDKKWQMTSSYRCSIIEDRKDLEQLIWNAEKDQQASSQL